LGKSAVGLVQRLLQQQDVLLVLLALNDDLLASALLLSQDLDGFGVVLLLRLQLEFQIADMGLQFRDGTSRSNNGIGFDLFKAN
jgi:hypothetical protein